MSRKRYHGFPDPRGRSFELAPGVMGSPSMFGMPVMVGERAPYMPDVIVDPCGNIRAIGPSVGGWPTMGQAMGPFVAVAPPPFMGGYYAMPEHSGPSVTCNECDSFVIINGTRFEVGFGPKTVSVKDGHVRVYMSRRLVLDVEY